MAEIPIEALIREAAQSRGVDPDLALKIAQKESDLYPRAKNKRSSAYGLFQITDPTWEQYGGTNENRYDLMDNIRIGVDIIASNRDRFLREFKRAPNAGELYTMHVFGQTGGPRIMRQDPNALMADVVSPKVIKANKIPKTQTVGEFIGMLQKKMGSKLDTQMAKRRVKEQTSGTVPMPAAPKETLRETREPVTPVSTNRIPAQRGERLQPLAEAPEGEDRVGVVTKDVLEKLGPNYQAALAAMTLGDTREDDDDDEESLSEQYAARQEDEQRRAEVPRSAALAGLDLSYQSPFGEEQPVMMAKGGIVHRAAGSPMYGEGVPDSGPVTADTRRALSLPQGLSAAEMMRMLKGVAGEGVSNLESTARGSVATVPGLVGDIESFFRSDKERKFATTPEVERQYLPSRLTKPTKESAGFVEMGTFIDPTVGLKVAKPVAKGTAKAALAGFKSVSPQLENILEKSAFGLDKMYIMRPSGGLFPSSKTYIEAPISNLDEQIKDAVKYMNLAEDTSPERAAALKFLDTKVRNYFRTQAGSVSDPVREAFISGRIKIPKDTKLEEMYPTALVNAARAGDVTAMRQLERQFDEDLSIRPRRLIPEEMPYGEREVLVEEYGQSILDQMKRNPNLIPDEMLLRLTKKDVGKLTSTQAKDKVAEIRQKLADNPTLFNTVFEEKIMRIMSDATDFVKPSNIENYPSLYGNLKEAVKTQEGIMGLQQGAPFLDTRNSPTILGQSFKDIATYSQMIPPAELERMDVPEVINRIIQLKKANEGVEPMAKKAASLISANKPVPENISTFGTKVVIPADDKGFVWREITDPAATKIQAKMLGNSIAGYSVPGTYGKLEKGAAALTSGGVRLFSLYDKNNQLMTNVEYITSTAKGKPIEEGKVAPNSITQFFGNGPKTGNVAPSDFGPQVVTLVKLLNPTSIPPTIRGILKEQGEFFPAAF
jgi:hypothetical protein